MHPILRTMIGSLLIVGALAAFTAQPVLSADPAGPPAHVHDASHAHGTGAAGLLNNFGPPQDFEGALEVIHWDDFAAERSEIRYYLLTALGERLELVFDTPHPSIPASDRIRVHGARSGDVVAAESGSISAVSAAATAPTFTDKKVAVVLFKFSNTASEPYTKAFAEGVAFTNSNSVANYYWENTWGEWKVSGTVFDWVTIPYTVGTTCDYSTWANAADAAVKTAYGSTALDGFGYKSYGFPSTSVCGWSGLANLPGSRAWLNGSGGMSLRTFSHELGHNFGTHHASTMNCTVGGLRTSIAANTNNCTWVEYGDPFTVMGGSSSRHNTNFSLGNFGLLQPANTQSVTADGTYTLAEVESYQPGLVQSLRIARPLSKFLTMELRQPFGAYFDATVPEGVYLRITGDYTSRTQSWLADPTTADTTFNAIPLNTPVYDPVRGVTLTVLGIAIDPVDGVKKASINVAFATDLTAPTQPTGLTAVAASASSINLDWAASADDVGVVGYRIYRNGSTSALATVTGNSYANVGLIGNTTYNYQVEAFDNSGKVSAKSLVASATTLSSDTTKPSDVTGVTATALSSLRMAVAWSAATDNVGVAGYEVSRATASAGPFTVLTSSAAGTSFTDTGSSGGITYYYRLRAKDTSNNYSLNYSAAVGAVAGVDVTAPSKPSLTATAVNSSTISLTWSATDNFAVTSYTLYRDSVAIQSGVTTTSYSDIGLSASTTYAYQVRAFDAAGNSAISDIKSATTATPDAQAPSPAPVLSVREGKGKNAKVTLSWTASTDNVGVIAYDIYKNGLNLGTVPGGTRSYVDSEVLPAAYTIRYQVKARDAAGNVAASNEVVIVN